MRDKRPVDELSIEELERVLAIRRREARQAQLNRMKRTGRVVPVGEPQAANAARPSVERRPEIQKPAPPPELDPIEQQLFGQNEPEPPVESNHHAAKSAPTAPAPAAFIKEPAIPHFEDNDAGLLPSKRRQSNDDTWRRFTNMVLLLVEVAAVAGLLYIGAELLGAIDTLEAETRSAQAISNATQQASLPTIEPTPTLKLADVVLPGGHTVDANGNAQFNYAEIPVHLLPRVQNQITPLEIVRPPRTAETALAVTIPALELDEVIVQGSDWDALRQGVGQVLNGARPGDSTGNVVLAAHNDIYGQLFRHLDVLVEGDHIYIRTEQEIHTYVVTHYEIVEPTQTEVMENKGRSTVTLISCYPYGVNDKRIVVFAERADTLAQAEIGDQSHVET